MVLRVGGRRALGVKIMRNVWAVVIVMVLEVGGRGQLASKSLQMH